jgi:hypothetical protein
MCCVFLLVVGKKMLLVLDCASSGMHLLIFRGGMIKSIRNFIKNYF